MNNVKYDIKRVPRELLEAFVIEVGGMDFDNSSTGFDQDLVECVRQAAKVPLRTKGEVAMDIVKAIRDYVKFNIVSNNCQNFAFDSNVNGRGSPRSSEVVHALINEETSD